MRLLPQVELETKHHFADGMYIRELFRPAGTLIVGKVHRKEHFYILLSGEITVITGDVREHFKAPKIIVSPSGTKRAVLAHTDSLCLTVHRTNSKNLDAIERELLEPEPNALFDASNRLKPEVIPLTLLNSDLSL